MSRVVNQSKEEEVMGVIVRICFSN